jgi:hypothetical protein
MLEFISRNWWVWIPVIAILLYLTRKNNQELKRRSNVASINSKKSKNGPLRKLAAKLGLSGVFNYIFPKR